MSLHREYFHSFILKLFIIINAPFFLSSCLNFSKSDDESIIIGLENEIKNLDIRFANDANSVHLARFVFQSLVEVGDDLQIQGDLATSFETSDHKVFRFKIPTNRIFHDGSPLTVQDVLFSFEQARTNPKIKSAFEDVESFETPSSNEFVIKLKAPRASFISSELPNIKVFSKNLGLSESQNHHPVGSGPFRFIKKSYRDIHLVPFENYFNGEHPVYKKTPRFKNLILRAIEDPTTRFLSILGGDIDILFNALSYRRTEELQKQNEIQVFRGPGTQFQYLGINLKNKKFNDIRVRKALNIAINRDEIIQHKLRGYASPATGPLPLSNSFYNTSLKPFSFDPIQAKKLLIEAGISDLELTIKSSSDRDVVSIMQVISNQWNKIGLKTTLSSREFASFFSDVQNGLFEVFSLRWTAVTEPDVLRKIFHSREFPPGRNRVFYQNSQVDRLLDLGSIEGNLEERKKIYNRVQQFIVDDLPYIPLWYPDNIVIARKSIKDFKLHLTGNWLSIINSQKKSSDSKSPL
jgi:peptide/nickel transport system substrate-binding protein